jgi:hypothetical protein
MAERTGGGIRHAACRARRCRILVSSAPLVPRSLPFRLLPLAVAAAALAVSTSARAAGLPPLAVHRTDDTADCPDARVLADKVAEQMHHPALAPTAEALGPDRGLDVQIYKSSEGYTAVIQAGGKTRQLSDKGPTCGGLAAALTVSIAVMLDTEPLPPEPEPPPPPAPPSPPPAATPPPAPAPSPPPADDRPSEGRRFRVAIAVSPILTDGVLRPFAGGVATELEFRFGRFSVAAGALALPGQTINYPPGQVNISLTTGLLRGCVAPVTIGGSQMIGEDESIRFALCLDTLAGVQRGVGQGFQVDRTSTLPWASMGASALFTQRIWGPLSWGSRAWLLIPLLKQSFFVDNLAGSAFSPSSVGGALDVGLRVSIW